MHWFWRAAIAVVVTILVYVGLSFALEKLLYSVVLIGRRAHMAIFFSVQLLNVIVAITAYGILTCRYRPDPTDRETRCRKCGYNLTGNVSGVCPECGERI